MNAGENRVTGDEPGGIPEEEILFEAVPREEAREDWEDRPDASEIERRAGEAFAALECALRALHKRVSPQELLDVARSRFIAPSAFFEAPAHLLESLGFNAREALLFSQIPALSRYLDRARYGKKPRLNHLAPAAEFLVGRYRGLAVERFYLLCLDGGGRLIECRLLQTGTDDSAPFYLRDVLAEIVRTRARAVVISHNHPNFSARPSREDLACTLELLGAVQPIGAVLLDHIIVCGREYMSVRQHGFIRAQLWSAQAPESRLSQRWLDPA